MRTVGVLSVHIISLAICKKGWRFPREDLPWVVTRNISGTIVILSMVFAMQYLPMGIYQIIYNTSPFWASLLAFFFLQERLKLVEIVAMIFSFTLIMLLFISKTQQPAQL